MILVLTVFTEQGSSASQLTAAKIMDVTAIQPDCAGHAADAVSAYTQARIEDAPKVLKITKSECRVFHDESGQCHGQASKTQRLFLNEICMDTHLVPSCENDNLREFCWDSMGKSTEFGIVCLFITNKDSSGRRQNLSKCH